MERAGNNIRNQEVAKLRLPSSAASDNVDVPSPKYNNSKYFAPPRPSAVSLDDSSFPKKYIRVCVEIESRKGHDDII